VILDRAYWRLLIIVLPCAVFALSVLALLTWVPRYAYEGSAPLPLRVLQDSEGRLEPATALKELAQEQPVLQLDTQLVEAPFWFSFSVPAAQSGQSAVVEVPSRHMTDLACWDGDRLMSLGSADRAGQQGRLFDSRAGFGLNLQGLAAGAPVLCQAHFIGPARLSAQLWSEDALIVATRSFERNAGLLEGGILMLALFVLITALINRNATYVLFAVWLLINLRAAALSAGWDLQWLGHNVPYDWLILARPITLALLLLGGLLCGVGVLPALVAIKLTGAHLRYQLYEQRLARGGKPLPSLAPRALPSERHLVRELPLGSVEKPR